jgi:hypothetical protein
VFRFATGKLTRSYDESLQAANELQRSESGALPLLPLMPLARLLERAPRQSAPELPPCWFQASVAFCCCAAAAAKCQRWFFRRPHAPNVPPCPSPAYICTAELYRLDAIDYGRRMATEKELAADPGGQACLHACLLACWAAPVCPLLQLSDRLATATLLLYAIPHMAAYKSIQQQLAHLLLPLPPLRLLPPAEAPKPNAIFDDSGNFLLYSTLLGIKVRRRRSSS